MWNCDKLQHLLNMRPRYFASKYEMDVDDVYKLKYKVRRIMEKQPKNNPEDLDRLAELLEKSGITLDDIERINQVKIGTYQTVTKDNEGNTQVHDLDVTNVTYTPKLDYEREFVSQADPTIIRPTKSKGKLNRKEKQALIVSDAQMWVGITDDKKEYPFHDPQALDIVQQIAKDGQPDQIVIVGDFADFPSLSRFKQDPAYQDTLNLSLNAMHQELARLRANAPNAKIVLLEGNHELRLRKYVNDEARKIMGIKRAGNESLSVLDLRYLLRLDELEIDYIDGYPNGRYWLNDRLKVIHGNTVKQLGKTVVNLVRNDNTSSITGHIHRFEMAARTVPERHMGRLIMAASFGTLSRIDGAVPSYHSSFNTENEPMTHIEQWQQGAGWVSYEEGDRPFDIQPIIIHTFDGYRTRFNDRTYTPN